MMHAFRNSIDCLERRGRVKSVALLALFSLCGCGGGGGSSAPPPSSFVPADVYMYGEVTYEDDDAWLEVNGSGFELAVNHTLVTRDGEPATWSHFGNGSLVLLHTDMNLPTSGGGRPIEWVDVQTAAIGPVQSVDAAHARLRVAGQQILLSNVTWIGDRRVIDGATLASVAAADSLEISGYVSTTGDIIATRIDRAASTAQVLVRGFLQVGRNAQFRIGQLDLDLSAATTVSFPASAPAVGDPVLAVGDSVVDNLMTVKALRFTGNQLTTSGDYANLRGVVTSIRSRLEFELEGRIVSMAGLNGKCGGNPGYVQAGTLVHVIGKLDNDFTLVADIVEDAAPVLQTTSLTGPVDTVDRDNGVISVLGFDVQSVPTTRISVDLNTLSVGDWVQAAGGGGGADGLLVADVILRLDQPRDPMVSTSQFTLQDSSVFVFGRQIRTNPNTVLRRCERAGYVLTPDLATLFGGDDDGYLGQLDITLAAHSPAH